MSYIDGYVIPAAESDKERYRAAAQKFHDKSKTWGAIRQVECGGDDVPDGKLTNFKRAVNVKVPLDSSPHQGGSDEGAL